MQSYYPYGRYQPVPSSRGTRVPRKTREWRHQTRIFRKISDLTDRLPAKNKVRIYTHHTYVKYHNTTQNPITPCPPSLTRMAHLGCLPDSREPSKRYLTPLVPRVRTLTVPRLSMPSFNFKRIMMIAEAISSPSIHQPPALIQHRLLRSGRSS